MATLDRVLRTPVVVAPMAGGPSTPELVAAVGGAGGLGFLAAGYRTAGQLAEDIARTRRPRRGALRGEPVRAPALARPIPGPSSGTWPSSSPRRNASASALGAARWEDDDWTAKLAILLADPVPVVSFTFGCPPAEVVAGLQGAGSAVVVTVTTPEEAAQAESAAPDALCVQGAEAGGHQSAFADATGPDESVVLLERLAAVATVRRAALARSGRAGHRLGHRRGPGRRRCRRPTGDRVLVLPGERHERRAPLGAARRWVLDDGADPRLQRALGPRPGQPVHGRAPRGPGGLSRGAPRHPAHPAGGRRWPAIPTRVNLWAGTGFAQCRSLPAAELVAQLVAESVE